MKYPDWFPNWRHDAFHQLQEKNARLAAEFQLNDWPRYDYDLDSGTLTFSKEEGVPKVIAEIQIAGSTSAKAGNWFWAWANAQLPPGLVVDAQLVRAFGEEHGISELTCATLKEDDLNALGWKLTSIMVRITNALGAYRPPRDEGGSLYLIYKSMTWAG